MRARAAIVAVVALFATSYGKAQAQPGEVGWRVTDSPSAQGKFIDTDAFGNVYVVDQGADSNSVLNVYDPFGDLVQSHPITGAVSSLAVDPFLGTAAVIAGNVGEVFWWNGLTHFFAGGTPLAMAFDQSSRLVTVFESSGLVSVDYYRDLTHDAGWSVAVNASGAQVDQFGNVLLFLSFRNGASGTTVAEFHVSNGNFLWNRTFNFGLTQGTFIAGDAEDSVGDVFLLLNFTDRNFPINDLTWVEAVAISNGNDLWHSPNLPGNANLINFDFPNLYVAGFSSSPFVAAIDTISKPGSLLWNKPQPSTAAGLTGTTSGPLTDSFDAAHGTVDLNLLAANTGLPISTVTAPAANAGDLGPVFGPGSSWGYYAGATGGKNSTATVQEVVFGVFLTAFNSPGAVMGGVNMTPTIAVSGVNETLSLASYDPSVALPPATAFITAPSTQVTITTFPVDADTPVTLTVFQTDPGIRKTANVTVKTATVSAVTLSAASLVPDETTTGSVTLTGPAGPSGKVVSLSSNNPDITVPASVHIAAGGTKALFTASSHPVRSSVTVTVTASLGSTAVSSHVLVKPPALKSFVVATTIVVGGGKVAGTVGLNGAPALNSTIGLVSSEPSAASAPATVPISGPTASFIISTSGVAASTAVSIIATFGNSAVPRSITVEPALLSTVVPAPASVKGGSNVSLKLTLTGDAPPLGGKVSLVSSNAALAIVPATASFGPNATAATVTVSTRAVTAQATVTLTATYYGRKVSTTITLTP